MIEDSIRCRIRDLLETEPNAGRYRIMEEFGLKEHEARAVLSEIRSETPTVIPIMKVACFDLETTNLKADVGRLLCGSIYSFPSGEMTTYRIDECPRKHFTDDVVLAERIRDKLEEHSILIGWNSKGFDVPFLNTRLVQNGKRKMNSHLHVDPMYCFRGWHGLKPRSSKLSTVAEFYDLDERKMDVDVSIWVRAMGGDTEAIDILVERCESDVRLLAHITAKAFESGLVKNISRYA